MIDLFKRYQIGLTLKDIYPLRNDNLCSCGCGKKLEGRKKRWASTECINKSLTTFLLIKGDSNTIRESLFKLDSGYCRNCGVYSNKWQADHIFPVFLGGAACGLDNLQTLCVDCHKKKSYTESHLNTISSHASCILANRRTIAFGAVSCEFPKQSIEIQMFTSATSPISNKFFSVY